MHLAAEDTASDDAREPDGASKRLDRWRYALGLAFLLVQVALVVDAQGRETRYFSWAPHTTQVAYSIDVTLDGRPLNEIQILQRYRVLASSWEAHSEANLFALIEQHETTYGAGQGAEVTVTYERNRGGQRQWKWPAQ